MHAISHSKPRNPQGIEFGSHGAGSFDALRRAHGDRKNPGDWWEYDRAEERLDSYDDVQGDRLVLNFATGRHDLRASEREQLERCATTWARRFG
jgi:hypothetical protein